MNKRKVKRLYPRRERALRAAGLALALLLFWNCVLHLGFLLPVQADYNAARREGVYGRLKTVAVQWKRDMMHASDRLSVVEGESSLSLRCTYWTFFGWEPSFLWPLDTSDGADAQAGLVEMARDGHETALVYFGRVKGTDIERLDAGTVFKVTGHTTYYGHEIAAAEQYVKNGNTYFISVVTDPVPPELRGLPHEESFRLMVNRGNEESENYEVEYVAGVSWG